MTAAAAASEMLLSLASGQAPGRGDQVVLGEAVRVRSASSAVPASSPGDDDLGVLLGAMAGRADSGGCPSGTTLSLCEPWAAAADPVAAWSWLRRCGGGEGWLGAWVQAHADRVGTTLDPAPVDAAAPAVHRVMVAERRAREAASGGTVEVSEQVLDYARSGPEAAAVLVAMALQDPSGAVSLARTAVRTFPFEDLERAVEVVLEQAVAAGLAEEVRTLATAYGPLLDQVGWHAAASCALPLGEAGPLQTELPRLVDRVEDQLPEDRWRSALPLLRAACRIGTLSPLLPYLGGWGLSTAQVAEVLVQERGPGALELAADERLVAKLLADTSWEDDEPAWWRGAHQLGREADALRAALALLSAEPASQFPPPHSRHLWGLGARVRGPAPR